MIFYDCILINQKIITGVSMTLPEINKNAFLYNPRKKMLLISDSKLSEEEQEYFKAEGEKYLCQEKNQKVKEH